VRLWHPRRELHRRTDVARWLVADARDVARIASARPRTTGAVHSIGAGLAGWQRSIERRRLIAVVRRGAIVGLLAACLLQAAAVVGGHAGVGPWLWPALLLGVLVPVPGILRRTSPAIAARMLDRDLGLSAGVTTALELECEAGTPSGLADLVLADGRAALARSGAGARARLRPRPHESGLLAALALVLAGLLLVPAVGRSPRTSAVAGARTPVRHAPTATESDPTRQQAGPDLRQFGQKQPTLPPLNAVPGTPRTGAAGSRSGHRATGSSDRSGPSVKPSSRTVGNAGYLQTSRTNGSPAPSASRSSGANGRGSSTLAAQAAPAARPVGRGASDRTTRVANERAANGNAAANGIPGRANARSGTSPRGGASAPGAGRSSAARHATPGGATAGTTRGRANAAAGVVPQLAGRTGLPIQAGYEAAKGSKGGRGESAADANGAGGASHPGAAGAGAAGAGGGGALPYVAPGSALVSPADRRLLLGYFGSYARVAAAGW
jgi:hypothetical protein